MRASRIAILTMLLMLCGGAWAITITPIPKPYTDVALGLASPHASATTAPGTRAGQPANVASYRINAVLDPARHTISGSALLTWRNRSASPVRSVYLHLYMNAFAGPGSTFMTERRVKSLSHGGGIDLLAAAQNGAPAKWTFIQPDNGPASDRSVIQLDLPAAVAPGASTSIAMSFLTRLPPLIARTGHHGSFHLAGQWFPKIGVLELAGERGATAARWNVHEFHANGEFYADFGHYDVRISVPDGYAVGATGALQGQPVSKNGWTTHHYAQDQVHDFAFSADRRNAAPLRARWRHVDISVLHRPEHAASAAAVLQSAKETLDYYGATLGPYPYPTLTLVIPPPGAEGAGSMEYPTFATIKSYGDPQPGTLAAYMQHFATIHEVGHNYFQGILASNEAEEPFLDEAVNEFWNHRMLRAQQRQLTLGGPLLKAVGVAPAFDSIDVARVMGRPGEPDDALGQNAWRRTHSLGRVYQRGPIMLRDLEMRIGSAAMERGFKLYYERWKFRHPGTADLRDALAEASGQPDIVNTAFAHHVYAWLRIDDRIDGFTSVATPAGYRSQVTLGRRGIPVAQTVRIDFADGSSQSAAWSVLEAGKTISWTSKAPPVAVRLDPQRLHYLDASKLDDTRRLTPDGSAARRWSGDFAAVANVLLALVGSL